MRRVLARWADPATPHGMLLTALGAAAAVPVLVFLAWMVIAAHGGQTP